MTENATEWNPDFVSGNPLFDDLRALFPGLPPRWPGPSELNRLIPPDLTTQEGEALKFCRQTRPLAALEYECHILKTGRVPGRERSWHDLFNALMWLCFGASKARINAIQVEEGISDSANRRSPRRNLTTLIDECGVLVAASDPHFEVLNRDHRWEHLFLHLRASWGREIRAYIIGHGLYEQCLRPYMGLTGKAVYFAVDSDFFSFGLDAQYRHLDRMLAARLGAVTALGSPRDLHPFPVLGVPGWYAESQDALFYRVASYFRPRK